MNEASIPNPAWRPEQVPGSEGPPPVSQDSSISSTSAGSQGAFPEIKGYQLLGTLGHGGMGVVYRAVQLATHRQVAVKVLTGGAFNSPRARSRFEREVELAARLNHPNIAKVFDSGLHYGAYYYAMELVEGQHLDKYVKQSGLDRRGILKLMQTVARAVQHAHQRGVIHRDLKPSNILVTDRGRPIVLDFGLAKAVVDESQPVDFTLEGHMAGTLMYVSPQQAAGQIDRLDTRADVYSLGVILFQLLTGQFPHDMTGTPFEIQRRIVEREIRRPRAIDPTMDRELESLLLKALAHDPEQRYADAGALAGDLGHYLNHQPLAARPLTGGYFLRKWLRRNWKPVTLATLVLGLLLGTGVYSFFRIRTERDRAAWNEQQALHSLYLSQISLAKLHMDKGQVADARAALDLCPPSSRQWEWHRLRFMADQSRLVIPGARNHDLLALSASGDRIVALINGAPATIYDAKTGVAVRTFPDFVPATLDGLWLHPQGERAAAASGDGTVRILDTATGTITKLNLTPVETPFNMSFSGQGRWMVRWRRDFVEAVQVADPAKTFVLPEVKNTVSSVVHDQGFLAWNDGQQIQLWDLSTRTRRWTVACNGYALRLDADGRTLWYSDDSGSCHQLDVATGKPIQSLKIQEKSPVQFRLSPDGKLLAAAQADGSIALWQTAIGELQGTLQGHQSSPRQIGFSADGRTLVSMSGDKAIRLWHTDQFADQPVKTIRLWPQSQDVVISSLRIRQGIVGIQAKTRRFFIWQDGAAEPRFIDIPDQNTSNFACAEDGRRLAVLNESRQLFLVDLADAEKMREVSADAPHLIDIQLSPNGQYLAATLHNSTSQVVIRDWDTAGEILRWPEHFAIAFSPDGRFLVTEDEREQALVIWSTRDWQPYRRYPGLRPSRQTAFDRDGTQLAITLKDQRIALINLREPSAPVRFLASKPTTHNGLAFNRAGNRLLTAGQEVKLYDTQSLSQLLTLSGIKVGRLAWFDDQDRSIWVLDRKGDITQWGVNWEQTVIAR